jgi:hypothetical protein
MNFILHDGNDLFENNSGQDFTYPLEVGAGPGSGATTACRQGPSWPHHQCLLDSCVSCDLFGCPQTM